MQLVLATNNPHKVDELRAIFAGLAEVIGLADLPDPSRFHEPEETGQTFDANCAIKALSYAAQTGRFCLADDSGLEVDALGGRPGVISSHYCTDGQPTTLTRADRDEGNNIRVLGELLGVPVEQRTARFVCIISLAAPAGYRGSKAPTILATTRGTFEGRIGVETDVPRGGNGFGYDPLFLVAPDFLRTSAELSPDEKNALSHRAVAAAAMAQELARLRL